ncbi:hypothetical protein DV737_g1467, partial [Chaetothyriales sp. CBS 132003]
MPSNSKPSPPGLPGFYFDADRGKYFRIQPNHIAPPDAKYSRQAVTAERRLKEQQHDADKKKFKGRKKQKLATTFASGVGRSESSIIDSGLPVSEPPALLHDDATEKSDSAAQAGVAKTIYPRDLTTWIDESPGLLRCIDTVNNSTGSVFWATHQTEAGAFVLGPQGLPEYVDTARVSSTIHFSRNRGTWASMKLLPNMTNGINNDANNNSHVISDLKTNESGTKVVFAGSAALWTRPAVVFDVRPGRRQMRYGMAFDYDDQLGIVVSASTDFHRTHRLGLWDVSSGRMVEPSPLVKHGFSQPVTDAQFVDLEHRGGVKTLLAACGKDILAWDM